MGGIEMQQEWEGGWIRTWKGQFCQNITPFPGSICLHGSTWTCSSYIAGAGSSRFTGLAGAYLEQENKCSLALKRSPEAATPPWDVLGAMLVPLHRVLQWIGLFHSYMFTQTVGVWSNVDLW